MGKRTERDRSKEKVEEGRVEEEEEGKDYLENTEIEGEEKKSSDQIQ